MNQAPRFMERKRWPAKSRSFRQKVVRMSRWRKAGGDADAVMEKLRDTHPKESPIGIFRRMVDYVVAKLGVEVNKCQALRLQFVPVSEDGHLGRNEPTVCGGDLVEAGAVYLEGNLTNFRLCGPLMGTVFFCRTCGVLSTT